MNQVWLPLERSQPDLRLWSLNVIALIHRENEKAMFPKSEHHCLLVNEELRTRHQSVWDFTNKIKGKSYDDEDDATMEIEAEEEEDCMDICS